MQSVNLVYVYYVLSENIVLFSVCFQLCEQSLPFTICLINLYTLCSEKNTHYIFDYHSGFSWSIFILFVPVERGMNTLQFIYLRSFEDIILIKSP